MVARNHARARAGAEQAAASAVCMYAISATDSGPKDTDPLTTHTLRVCVSQGYRGRLASWGKRRTPIPLPPTRKHTMCSGCSSAVHVCTKPSAPSEATRRLRAWNLMSRTRPCARRPRRGTTACGLKKAAAPLLQGRLGWGASLLGLHVSTPHSPHAPRPTQTPAYARRPPPLLCPARPCWLALIKRIMPQRPRPCSCYVLVAGCPCPCSPGPCTAGPTSWLPRSGAESSKGVGQAPAPAPSSMLPRRHSRSVVSLEPVFGHDANAPGGSGG